MVRASASETGGAGSIPGRVISKTLKMGPLLHDMKEQALGSFVGTTYVGALAVADDFLFLSNSADELQMMLDLKYTYSGERRYRIHPIKTVLVPRVATQSSKNTTKTLYSMLENQK